MKYHLRALPWALCFASSALGLATFACNDAPMPQHHDAGTDADAGIDGNVEGGLGTVAVPADAIAIELASGGGMPWTCFEGGPPDAPTTTFVLRLYSKKIERVFDPVCGETERTETTPAPAVFDALVERAKRLTIVPQPKNCGRDGPSYTVRSLLPVGTTASYMSSASDDACTTSLTIIDGDAYSNLWADIRLLLTKN